MRLKLKDACITVIYIFVFIAALTYMRYTLDEGSVWGMLYRFSVFCILGLCLVYFSLVVSARYVRIKKISILLVLYLFYIFFVSYLRNLLIFPAFFVDAIPWVVLFLVFYNYSINSDLPKAFKPITIVGISLVCAFSIPNIEKHVRYVDGNAIFSTYFCFSFLPMLYYCCRSSKKIVLAFNVIVLFLMLLSLKRAAFIISVAGVGIYYMLKYHNESRSKRKIRLYLGLTVAAVFLIYFGQYVIERLNLNILDRLTQMVEDGGSGRNKIWEAILNEYNASSWQQRWMGHGFHAVLYRVKPLGIQRYAHNSWIEFLYDYGIIGVFVLALFVIKIITQTIRLIMHKDSLSPIMGFSCVLLIILSAVSYFFEESTIILPICVVWGICMGNACRLYRQRKSLQQQVNNSVINPYSMGVDDIYQ